MLRAPYSHEERISLEPIHHVYQVDGKTGYQSVTEVIKQFFAPFPKAAIIHCLMKGKDKGKTYEQIEAGWRQTAAFGTRVHELIEIYLTTGLWETTPEEMVNGTETCLEQFRDFWAQLAETHPIKNYRPEVRIFDEENHIAGSIDLIVEFQDGTTELFDWKCVKQLRCESSRKGHEPFAGYTDTNLTHYTIQLNLYKYILERNFGLVISRMSLVQFHPTLESWKQIPLIQITCDIQDMVAMLPQKSATQSQRPTPRFLTVAPSEA